MSGGRKIILHIGLHKTGTTTIQNVLHANRDFLLGQERVLYPSLAPNLSSPLLTIFREDPRKLKINKVAGITTDEIAVRREKYLNSLDAEISSSEWDTLLLSAEGVSHLSASEVGRLREWGEKYSSEWMVLVCVRHPVDWTRSAVQERLKQGDTLRQLYKKKKIPTPKYRLKISRAMSVFGRENVRVFDFETAVERDGGIVRAFAQQAGLSTSSADFLASQAVRRYNESLSLEAARILDSLNRQHPMLVNKVRAPRRAGPGHELSYISRIKGQKFDVPNSVKENIRLLSREDVVWLNETFALDLYRDVTDFAPQGQKSNEEPVVVQEDEAAPALSDASVDSIAEIIGELVTESAFHRVLSNGREALGRGDLERAVRVLREAARLDPDAPQPKKLLEEAKLLEEGNLKEKAPKEGAPKESSAKQQRRFSRWLKP